MPDVTMPNGDVVTFPNDMPRDKIKQLILSKFPDAERIAQDKSGAKPYDNPLQVLGKAVYNAPGQLDAGIRGVIRAGADAVSDAVSPSSRNPLAPVDSMAAILPGLGGVPDPSGALSFLPDGIKKQIGTEAAKASIRTQLYGQQTQEGQQPLDARPGSVEGFAGDVVGSLAQMAPALAASIAIKNPAPMAASGFVQAGGQEYTSALTPDFAEPGTPLVNEKGEVTDLGGGSAHTTQDAREMATLYGAAEGVGDAVALGKIMGAGGGVLKKLVTGVIGEGAQEATTEALNFLTDLAYAEPGLTWGEARQKLLEAAPGRIAYAGAVGAAAGAPIGIAAHLAEGSTPEAPVTDATATAAKLPDDEPAIEDQLSLPAPDVMLALPAPTEPPNVARRQAPAPNQPEAPQGQSEIEAAHQAQIALRKTRQTETAELLQTARETVRPLGVFSPTELEALTEPKPQTRSTETGKLQVKYGRDGAWHDGVANPDGTITSPGAEADRRRSATSAVQRVNTWRMQTGKDLNAPITIEDMARAKVPQTVIDSAIAARRPLTQGEVLRPLDVTNVAAAKNIIADDANFKELAFRTTGARDINRMSQTQLKALHTTLDAMPRHETPVTLPITEVSPFNEGQYNKAVDAVRTQGRYTLKAIKDATGLTTDKDAHAVRDAMVRRGQLVQKSKSDFRLYDVLGTERQTTPDQVPKGAFSEHIVKRLPVNKIQVRVDGKSVGSFASGTEARNKIRELRAKEAEKGGTPAKIELGAGEEVAYGVMENRYDERGNLLGQVVVDTHRDETAARKAAEKLNTPDDGVRYTQTTVDPTSRPAAVAPPPPIRQPAPAALAGRMPEIVQNLNAIAKQRGLPLLGTKVSLQNEIRDPTGTPVEGVYIKNLIAITAGHLDPEMTVAQTTDRLAQVMDHELIHALKQAGVLSPDSEGWKAVVAYARKTKRPGENTTYLDWAKRHYSGVPGYTTPADIEEEAIAEAFRVWASNRRNVVGKVATLFRQLVEWFRRLRGSIPSDVFTDIESGRLVRDALIPPGANEPRARAGKEMMDAGIAAQEAAAAQDENKVRVASRQFLRARAQAREDRFGRAGPKTVLGTTPTKVYDTAAIVDRGAIEGVVYQFKQRNGVTATGLSTFLPEDIDYLKRVADAQQKAVHDPDANDVAKAYRALTTETKTMFDALGDLRVEPWIGDGAPYASPAEMFADLQAGRIKMRLSDDMFGEGPDNPGHPMNAASGRMAADGRPLTNNDLFRVVHDVYGRAPLGLRSDPRGDFNAYHEHARLLSPDARKALATETLAQSAWHHYGPHLRRRDGSVPRPNNTDYLPPARKEFAEQKAFLLPQALLDADRGWALADEAASAVDDLSQPDIGQQARYMVAYHGTPHKVDKFSLDKIGTGEGAQAFGHGLYFAGKKEVADHYRKALTPFDPAKHSVKWRGENIDPSTPRSKLTDLQASAKMLINRMESGQSFSDAKRELLESGLLFDSTKKALREMEEKDFTTPSRGNLYQVDLPEDSDMLDWDLPLSEQPKSVREKLNTIKAFRKNAAAEKRMSPADWRSMGLQGEDPGYDVTSGQTIYYDLSRALGGKAKASRELAKAGIPGHRYFDGMSRDKADGTRNYVIYDDSRIQILEENPKFSRFKDDLPGGRLYGNPNRSPGGTLSKPGTASPAFGVQRDGNRFFGGDLADEQLRMVIEGDRGATLVYLTPDEFAAIADQTPNSEQAVYDAALAEGYKFNTLPSLVVDGYAGIVRAPQSDGAFAARAIGGQADLIPVVLYPKRGESLGLVTALEANGMKVPWPQAGRQENYLEARGEEPKYSLNAPFGDRVPEEGVNTANIVDQRIDTWVGKKLHAIGRSKIGVGKIPSVFDLRVKFQDKMLSVKEMIENVRAMGGTISDDNDVYMLEQLAGARTVHQIEDRGGRLYEPLFEELDKLAKAKVPVSVKEFEDFLYARHAPERNTYLRSRGSKIANPSGMSDAEAEAILDKLAMAGKYPQLERLAGMADAIARDTTRTRVEAGLITQAAADASPYQFYIPLRGKNEEDLDPEDVYDPQTRARSGKGYTVGGREDRAVTGRSRKAGDLISHLLLQNTESVIRAEKNNVALSFMRLMNDNPNMGYGKIVTNAPTRQVVGANGMIREAGDPSYRQRPDVFTAKYNGKEIIAQIDDPRVARAMKADYVSQSGPFVNALGLMNRYLATVNTSFNPEFLISNIARDMQTAGILGTQYDIKGLSRKIIAGAPKAALGIREVLRNGTTNSPMARAFKELQDAGGTTEFLGLHDLDTHIRRLRRDAANTGLNPTARQAWERVKKIGEFIDDYNKVAENAFRLGAYVAARDAGVSVPKAAFLAKNLTVNFNKGGENKSLMNSLYLFYNASISGTFVLLNGLKNPRVQKLVAGIAVAGMLSDILNRSMSGDDDDNGVKDYDDIPDYVLETNWVFMIPGSKDYVSIPMPYGFNLFHNLGRNLSNAFSGSPVHSPGKSAMSMLMTTIGAFNPMGGSNSVLNFVSPTFADPFMDLVSNTDFAGNQIVPERPTFGLPVPDSQKYWSNTGDIPKWVAERLNALTGGNEVRKGAVDMSPETLQYWFDYATGATGKFVQRNANLANNVLNQNFEDITLGDIPMARRVVGSVTNRGNTERYYDNATEVKTVAAELKAAQEAGDADRARGLIANKLPQIQMIKTFEAVEKTLSGLRKQIRTIRENDALSASEKHQAVKAMQEQQDTIMAQVNRSYFAALEPKR